MSLVFQIRRIQNPHPYHSNSILQKKDFAPSTVTCDVRNPINYAQASFCYATPVSFRQSTDSKKLPPLVVLVVATRDFSTEHCTTSRLRRQQDPPCTNSTVVVEVRK
jgi:hypothetical protein